MILDDEEESAPGLTESERELIRSAACKWAKRFGRVQRDHELSPRLEWRPHFYCPQKKIAVHVLLYPRLAERYEQAFKQAHGQTRDLRIAIVGPDSYIRATPILAAAARTDAMVTVLRGPKFESATRYVDVFRMITKERLMLPTAEYKTLAGLAVAAVGKSQGPEKGRRLEGLTGFLLSQVPGFRVVESNYNTATEEIDIVVENGRIGGIFQAFPEPLILAECKNTQKRAGKNEYVALRAKMKNRRQAVSVGLFFSLTGYARDFRLEALRDSRERMVIATFSRDDVQVLTNAWGEEAAALVEARIRAAVLD